jgi:iron complex transport system substrate-binding protein
MGNSIVANTIYCDYPPEAKLIPKVGSWIRIDIEKLKPFKPDIVFTSSIVQKKISHDARAVGLQVINIDPRTLRGIYDSILEIGRIIDRSKQAQRIVDSLLAEEAVIRKNQPQKKLKLYIEEWFNPPMISGNWVPDIVNISGYSYGIVQAGELSRAVSLDEVRSYDPDIILSSYCGFGKNSNPHHILNRPGWNSLRAVIEKSLFSLDETILNRPGPRILQSVTDIIQAIRKCETYHK